MRKIVLSAAVSLDGYISGPKGEIDWILMDPEIDFAAIFSRFDTALIGRRSFEVAQAQGHDMMPGIKSIVVSRTMRQADHPKFTIINNPSSAIQQLRAEPGKDIWLFGGGELFRSMLALGLVDAVEVAIIPVLLGGGIPLLPTPADRAVLRLVSSRIYKKTGIVALDYAVEPQ